MRTVNRFSSLALLAILCTGCSHRNASPPPQAQAPPLQTGQGTLNPPKTTQPQEKSETPLASPLPPPSAQSVPLPPPPPPKKVRKRVKQQPPAKPADTAQLLRPPLPRVRLLSPRRQVPRSLRRLPSRNSQRRPMRPPRPLVN